MEEKIAENLIRVFTLPQAEIQRVRRENLEHERNEKQRKERERALEVVWLRNRCNEIGGI